jgi:hypothetical protein
MACSGMYQSRYQPSTTMTTSLGQRSVGLHTRPPPLLPRNFLWQSVGRDQRPRTGAAERRAASPTPAPHRPRGAASTAWPSRGDDHPPVVGLLRVPPGQVDHLTRLQIQVPGVHDGDTEISGQGIALAVGPAVDLRGVPGVLVALSVSLLADALWARAPWLAVAQIQQRRIVAPCTSSHSSRRAWYRMASIISAECLLAEENPADRLGCQSSACGASSSSSS